MTVRARPKERVMSMTRRELCSMLPAALIPAIHASGDSTGQDISLLSAMYPFEKLAVRTESNTEYRDVLNGKLATGESLEVHETTAAGGSASSSTPSPALRNVADSRGNGGNHGERREVAVRDRLGRIRGVERRAWNQKCGKRASYLFCCGSWPRREFLSHSHPKEGKVKNRTLKPRHLR